MRAVGSYHSTVLATMQLAYVLVSRFIRYATEAGKNTGRVRVFTELGCS